MKAQRAVILAAVAIAVAAVVAVVFPDSGLPSLHAAGTAQGPAPTDLDPEMATGEIEAPPPERSPLLDEPQEDEAPRRVPTRTERDRYGPLVADLLDDGIPFNAAGALMKLATAEDAEPLLREALDSRDAQQRRLAAIALVYGDRRPTRRLAEVLVDVMRGDVADELQRTLAASSARIATRYLYNHPAGSLPALRRALWSGDRGQRFLAAFLIASQGSTANLHFVVHELVGRLVDNDRGGDALMASHALFRVGRPVAPYLRDWRPVLDDQARQLIDLVLLDLEHPPVSEADFRGRSALHNVTTVYYDPVVEFEVGYSALATR